MPYKRQMPYKRLTALLTVVLSCVCAYYLNFTFIARRIEREATQQATTNGKIDYTKKQEYLEEQRGKVVFRIPVFGKEYTYEQVLEREIQLGNDLQPGVHMTLEIDTLAVLQDMAGDKGRSSAFRKIISRAKEEKEKDSQESVLKIFYKIFKEEYPGQSLNSIFYKREIGLNDEKILSKFKKELKEIVEHTITVIQKRLNGPAQLGGAIVRPSPQDGLIEIEKSGTHSVDSIKKIINSTAEVSYNDPVEGKDELNTIYESIKNIKTQEGEKLENILSLKGNVFTCKADNIQKVRKILASDEVSDKLSPLGYSVLTNIEMDEKIENTYRVYAIKTGEDNKGLIRTKNIIKEAKHKYEGGQHRVYTTLTSDATTQFAKITENRIGKRIAIIMKGYAIGEEKYDVVISVPGIQKKIESPTSYIKGDFTKEQAEGVASLLDSGSKPAPSTVISTTITGASIGEEEKNRAFIVFFLVLLLIMLFMSFYYGKGGVIASIGLLFNMLFILGTMGQLNASLDLPSIAGILLTFGMSVDANVLIFEMIRQLMRKGVYIGRAVEMGYTTRALSSIIDGQVTTLLTGIILYTLGQGPIKGFASTLIIGIISSLFTSVMVTRLLIELIGPERMNFGFSFTQNLFSNLKINFYHLRKKAYIFSLTTITIGMGCIVYNGGISPQLGVQFTGGREFVVKFDTKVSSQDIKEQLPNDLNDASVEAKTFGASNIIQITTNYRINEKGQTVDKQTKNTIIKSLEKITKKTFEKEGTVELQKDKFTIQNSTTVSASVAGYAIKMTIWAILLALIMIFGYILIRFKRWQLGLAAVLALCHDVLMIFSSIGIARALGVTYEIDLVFVGGVLTVIGYSINDTVVVFDFYNEEAKEVLRSDFKELINRSINGTLSRTLITTFTTLISVGMIFGFGGEALRCFSFTLLVGIIMGTFSSIFALALSRDLEKVILTFIEWVKFLTLKVRPKNKKVIN